MKTVLITGGTGGIGKSLVKSFAQSGWNVVFTTRSRPDEAESMAVEYRQSGESVYWYRCDIADEEDVSALAGDVLRRFHHVHALVNNAGVAHWSLFTDTSASDWDRVFAVDVRGVFLMTRAFLPGMISRRGGSVVNISSMWGQVGASCEVCYSAAKAAVIGMTKALSQEVGPSGVRVNCIAPGVIDTAMNGNLTEDDLRSLKEQTPLCRIGSPDDVAQCALFLAGDFSSFITGQVIGVNGGFVV